ncbi:MAG TPA: SufE family protein, partial [Flavobacteriales bacterium]|nr:SufE family protein [Flavobacteriales bacterium]
MSIKDKESEIVEEFAMFEDWDGKYEYLIDLGKDLPAISAEYKT